MATITSAKEKTGGSTSYKTHQSMKNVIDYIYKLEKTSDELMKGKELSPESAYEEMMLNKINWDKAKENGNRRMVVHLMQSFKPGEITADKASEIADRFLQHKIFDGYMVAYATHTDKPHIHTHFVIDTVNKNTGEMWHISKQDLQDLKDYSDEICKEYGLSIVQKKNQKSVYKSRGEVEAVRQGRSWKQETNLAVTYAASLATSRRDFINLMNKMNYQVSWTNNRRYITFQRNGHKIRNKTLAADGRFDKESLLKQFEHNRQTSMQIDKSAHNESIDVQGLLHDLIKYAANNKDRPYPLQTLDKAKDGQMYRLDRMKQSEKGYGIDWERE